MRHLLTRLLLAAALLLSLAAAATAGEGGINQELIDRYKQQVTAESNTASINAISNNDIEDLSLNRQRLLKHDKLFSHKLKLTGVTNQKSSGRCWLFAGANVLSPKVMQTLDLDDFEFSQPYLTFYDKLEKANFFLERIIEMRDKPIDDRSLYGQLEYFFGDGGWFHFFTDLVKKYGLVPLPAMTETKQSVKTGDFNRLSKTILRSHAAEIRRMHVEGKSVAQLRERKEEMLADIYKLLVYNYGVPPTEFTYRYEAEEDSVKKIVEKQYTPMSFYEEFWPDGLPEYVAIVHNPTIKFDQLYELEESRNVYDNPDFTVLNLTVDKLKEYTLAALLDSQAVWFSCDVGKDNYGAEGVFAVDIYQYDQTFDMDFGMTKADRITYNDISPSHAMIICGVDTAANGTPTKWLVENSWGTKNGDDGRWCMYDDWFTEYVLLVMIDKKLLSDEDREKLKQKPEKIADWQPFFLALRNLD